MPLALKVPKADVKGKAHQSVKLALMTKSSRAKSGHAALKPRKVLRQDSVHLSHREAGDPSHRVSVGFSDPHISPPRVRGL
jgi:hypothetical protein